MYRRFQLWKKTGVFHEMVFWSGYRLPVSFRGTRANNSLTIDVGRDAEGAAFGLLGSMGSARCRVLLRRIRGHQEEGNKRKRRPLTRTLSPEYRGEGMPPGEG